MNDQEKLAFIQTALSVKFGISRKISAQDRLIDLGLDSLDAVELQLYYEDQTGCLIENDVIIVDIQDMMSAMT